MPQIVFAFLLLFDITNENPSYTIARKSYLVFDDRREAKIGPIIENGPDFIELAARQESSKQTDVIK